MFRLSLRELFMFVTMVAICLAWWLDRHALALHAAEAAQDARALRHLTMPDQMMCGQQVMWLEGLRDKYDAPIFSELMPD